MPRAKVQPNARKRVVQACRQCKASKRKCNASLPCNYCIKKGIADACDVSDTQSLRRESLATTEGIETGQNAPSSNGHSSSDSRELNRRLTNTTSAGKSVKRTHRTSVVQSQEGLNATSPDATRAHMLSNNHGEFVFVGRSASLSFLQLVRETTARCMGPSEFSEYASRDSMLEVDLEVKAGSNREIILDAPQQQLCIEYYFLATTGLIDVLGMSEARDLLENNLDSNPYLAATRLLIIAIGMQAQPTTVSSGDCIEKCAFAEARHLVFNSMLENPSIDMIRAFLLLSFYMLGACRRNASFLYLGIAARAAHTLGLHTAESYTVLDRDRGYAQLKCWKSLVSLDLTVSSILGRTTAILAQRSDLDTMAQIPDSMGRFPGSELEAVYQLALIIDSISSQFNGHEPITVEMAQSHLKSLKNWSSNLPAKLRPCTVPEDHTNQTRQALLGCMHISCFYYFAVMLVTRPFLIINVNRRLFWKRDNIQMASIGDSTKAEELASACLNAALYMAQTCSDLLDFSLLADNMCILKAWIFSAGLVLGFEMFATMDVGADVESAFLSCRRVLQHLASRSPQASQYYEILTLFSLAIGKHKQMKRSRKSQNPGSMVTRIMNLHAAQEIQQGPSMLDYSEGDMLQNQSAGMILDPSMPNGFNNQPEDFYATGDFVPDLDDFSIPSAESFMFDLQSFGMMPWAVS